MSGGSLTIQGPGAECRQQIYDDVAAAMFEQSSLEHQLVRDGWSLERMTTERRSGADRRASVRTERRRGLRLVDRHATTTE